MTTGLVLGKFYPPHAGHHYLIYQASKMVDHLVVLIWWSEKESISGETRARILKEVHPEVKVISQQCEIVPDYDNPDVWDEHMQLLLNQPTRQYVWQEPDFKSYGSVFDCVFTSENYGDELARRLDAKHICIDPERVNVPISGTAIREDPAANWQHLAEPTRALLTKRFVVTGAESTGTTTLTRSLAQHYNTVWVPEYGRFYTEGSGLLNHEWTTDEFIHIVEGQHLAEDFLARKAGPVMFCDTDALSTAVWHERYTWKHSPQLESMIRSHTLARYPHYAHYFITDYAEVPFEDDGLRDGNNDIRQWMQNRIIEMVVERTRHSQRNVLVGGPKMRMAHATGIVDQHLKEGWNLNPPLGQEE